MAQGPRVSVRLVCFTAIYSHPETAFKVEDGTYRRGSRHARLDSELTS
jgi:hypothetical protein